MKDFIFAIVWNTLGYLFLFVFRSFSFLINNMLEGSHNSTIQLLNKVGVPLIGYILLGMLIGILALNLRYFSRLSLKDGNPFQPDNVSSEYFDEAELKYGPFVILLNQLIEEINRVIIEFVEELTRWDQHKRWWATTGSIVMLTLKSVYWRTYESSCILF